MIWTAGLVLIRVGCGGGGSGGSANGQAGSGGAGAYTRDVVSVIPRCYLQRYRRCGGHSREQ
jgi:hypothetical protein